jgi:DUF917 family protein
VHDLDDLALGAAVLGTGGGGDPHIGKLTAVAAMRRHGDVTLIDLADLADDDLVVPAAMMGAQASSATTWTTLRSRRQPDQVLS